MTWSARRRGARSGTHWPDITLLSPDPKSPVKVRPDDSVPIRFTASDDFGISRVEARVRVDDRPPQTLAVPLDSHDARTNGEWSLDVAAVLKGSPGVTEARRIVCEFVAVDNRDPDAQPSSPARLTLDLDKNTAPLVQRLDADATKDLTTAVNTAADKLKAAQTELDALKKSDTAPRLSAKTVPAPMPPTKIFRPPASNSIVPRTRRIPRGWAKLPATCARWRTTPCRRGGRDGQDATRGGTTRGPAAKRGRRAKGHQRRARRAQ